MTLEEAETLLEYGSFYDLHFVLDTMAQAIPNITSEITVLDGRLTLTDTQNTIQNSNVTVTATAKGSLISKKTNTPPKKRCV